MDTRTDQHTPLPWVGFADQGKCVAIMPAGRDGDICTFKQPPNDADADLILRSVNALPSFVKALEDLDVLLDFNDDELSNVWTFDDLTEIREAFKNASAVLASYRHLLELRTA